MTHIILEDAKERMNKTIESYLEQLNKLKTGRANVSLVKDVEIDYYGCMTPIYQVANISVPEASQILIKPYDKAQLRDIEKAIINADLGMTPLNDGSVIRCNVPQLTGETRARLVKDAFKMAEDAKIAIRNIRRDAIAEFKKDKSIPEDMLKSYESDVQKLTDDSTKKIDEYAKGKEKELTTI